MVSLISAGKNLLQKWRPTKRGGLTDEISAASSHDLFEVFIANTVMNPDKVVQLESRGQGLKLYEEMEKKDGHIASVLQTRKFSVTSKEWEVIPAEDDPEGQAKADYVEKIFNSLNFDKVCLAQLDSIMKGFAVSETMYDVSEGDIWITGFKHRKPWRFAFTVDGGLSMLTEKSPVTGEQVPEDKFWIFTFSPKYENRYGEALGQTLFWPYLFKKNNIRWWAIFNEKFGSPTAIGKYRPGTKKDMQDKLLAAIKSIQQETGVVIPDDMVVELLEASRQGSFETYNRFMDWCEQSESKVVLGQTLTTQQGSVGSQALGMVHERVRADITKADADMLCSSLNDGPVKRIVDMNWGPSKAYPKIWIRAGEEKDLVMQASRDKSIFDMGYKPKQEYIEDTYGVPVEPWKMPTPINPTPTASPVKEGEIERSGKNFAENHCPHCFSEQEQIPPAPFAKGEEDSVDHLTDTLLKSAAIDPWLVEIEKIMNESRSLEDFRNQLLNAYTEMNQADLGNLLQRAFVAAELAGRWEAGNPPRSPFDKGGKVGL